MGEKLYQPISIKLGCLANITDRQTPGNRVQEKWTEQYQLHDLIVTPSESGVTRKCPKCGKEAVRVEYTNEETARKPFLWKSAALIILALIVVLGRTPGTYVSAAFLGFIALAYLGNVFLAKPYFSVYALTDYSLSPQAGFSTKNNYHRLWKDGKTAMAFDKIPAKEMK